MMFPIGRKVHIALPIIHIKTNNNWAGRGSQQAQISITGIDIFANRGIRYTYNFPCARVYPLPVHCKVHMVNFWVAFTGRIGIGGEVYHITCGRACRSDPRAPRFYMRRKEYIPANASSSNENKRYAQDGE